jgi:hypothetical protein
MTLRDRFRRWWSPARWEEQHPLNAQQRAERRMRPPHWEAELGDRRVNVERDFKKPH